MDYKANLEPIIYEPIKIGLKRDCFEKNEFIDILERAGKKEMKVIFTISDDIEELNEKADIVIISEKDRDAEKLKPTIERIRYEAVEDRDDISDEKIPKVVLKISEIEIKK